MKERLVLDILAVLDVIKNEALYGPRLEELQNQTAELNKATAKSLGAKDVDKALADAADIKNKAIAFSASRKIEADAWMEIRIKEQKDIAARNDKKFQDAIDLENRANAMQVALAQRLVAVKVKEDELAAWQRELQAKMDAHSKADADLLALQAKLKSLIGG